jgi:hypothetical protein
MSLSGNGFQQRTFSKYPRASAAINQFRQTDKTYCGVFTPCKNCNIEIRSHDYASVDETVFSPCRAELCRAVTSRALPCIASPCLLPGNGYKHLNNARVERGYVPRPQWPNNRRAALFSRVSDQRFIGETEARLQAVLGGRQPLKETSCEQLSVEWENNSGSENSAVQVSSRRELWRVLLWR